MDTAMRQSPKVKAWALPLWPSSTMVSGSYTHNMQFSDCEKCWFTISHPERMKAVGWCAVVSSPESSPEKLWGQKCFHRYEDRTRPAPRRHFDL